MKNLILRIWNNWKAIVDEHNSHITYVDYDNAWDYSMPLLAIIWGVAIGGIFGLYHLSVVAFLYGFFGMAIPIYFFLIWLPVRFEQSQKNKNCA